tara:strand:- start:381 stop:551 length:171 start_codon:yes stop_codon:yes gene_type:complete
LLISRNHKKSKKQVSPTQRIYKNKERENKTRINAKDVEQQQKTAPASKKKKILQII